MRRTLDPEAFNRIANDASVRPSLGGQGDLDLTAVVENPDHFAFLTDCRQGGYLYHKQGLGLYEVHTLALPSARGRPMLRAMWDGLGAMFLSTDAIEIVTMVPDFNKDADALARHAGFREMYRRENAWEDGVGVSFRTLGYAEWVWKDAGNRAAGALFHEEIHALTPDDHGEDPVHDAWVGATVRGAHEGNLGKCAALYNRWAALARYLPVSIVSVLPPVVDIGSAVVQIGPTGLEVLKVRAARSAPSENPDPGEALCPSAPPLPPAPPAPQPV